MKYLFSQPTVLRISSFTVALTLGLGLLLAGSTNAQEQFRSGDRITFLGGTSTERMQEFGYFETLITSSYPNRDLKFRNIGWSGDDVSGLARAVFGKQPDGFARLKSDLELTKPTVVVIAYGANESYAGEAGVKPFLSGLDQIVQLVSKLNARAILISPSYIEDLGRPLPDPTAQNENLARYTEAMKSFADERKIPFVDFYMPLGDRTVSETAKPAIRDQLTDNGRHFNAFGHWRTAMSLAEKLGVSRPAWTVSIDPKKKTYDATGTLVTEISIGDSIEFTATDDFLPVCAPPNGTPRGGELAAPHDRLQIDGLVSKGGADAHWGLQIDGKPAVLATAEEWAAGVFINRALYLDHSAKLREAIRKKNELFFHRHRPQNETYLFLFRKHEQGNNAAEIPQFDRLIEEQEQVIAQLKKPAARRYKIVRVEKPNGTTKDSDNNAAE